MPRMLQHTVSDRRSVSVITEAQRGLGFVGEGYRRVLILFFDS